MERLLSVLFRQAIRKETTGCCVTAYRQAVRQKHVPELSDCIHFRRLQRALLLLQHRSLRHTLRASIHIAMMRYRLPIPTPRPHRSISLQRLQDPEVFYRRYIRSLIIPPGTSVSTMLGTPVRALCRDLRSASQLQYLRGPHIFL